MGQLDADVIIIGAGTSGGAVARELRRSRPDLSVIVIEAGSRVSAGSAPDSDTERVITSGFNWDYHYDSGFRSKGVYPTGKLLGGSSAINGALAFYPTSADWNDAGLTGYVDFEMDTGDWLVGRSQIAYGAWTELDALDTAFVEWAEVSLSAQLLDRGHRYPDDGESALFLIGRNVERGRRINSFSWTESASPALRIETGRCVQAIREQQNFVEVASRDGQVLTAKHAFVTAGVIGSPALLQRSGLLARCLADGNAIGGFKDHPTFVLWCPMTDMGFERWSGRWRQVGLTTTSEHSAGAMLGLLKGVSPTTIPRARDAGYRQPMVGIACMLHNCDVRGWVDVCEGQDPVLTWEPGESPTVVSQVGSYLPLLLDIAAVLRAKGLVGEPFLWNKAFLSNSGLQRAMLSAAIQPGWHGVSTLSLDRAVMEKGLLNQIAAVSGSKLITVCDASIIPDLPKIPTNLLVSKMAALITKAVANEIQ